MFRSNGSTWEQTRKLLPSDGFPGSKFGSSVAVSGEIVIVGNDNFNFEGAYVFHLSALPPVTGVESATVPATDVRLLPSSPNPFTGRTRISFELPQTAPVDVAIYDVAGRKVRTLVSRTFAAGRHGESWDGRDDSGAKVASGFYFVRLTSLEEVQSQRVAYVK